MVFRSGTAQVESISIAAGSKTLEEFRGWVKTTLWRGLSVGHPPLVIGPSTQAPVVTQQQESAIPPLSPQTPTVYDPPAGSPSTTNTQDKGKAKALSEDSSSTSTSNLAREGDHRAPKANNSDYVDGQQKLKMEAQVEKERVRRLLEVDKVMRAKREREVQVAREREKQSRIGQVENETVEPVPSRGLMETRGGGVNCALSFRLLDGSSLKHRFPAEATLGVDVRKWIDQVLHLTVHFPPGDVKFTQRFSG